MATTPHDLQFQVQNGDVTQSRPEMPVAGEMDHLPDSSAAAAAVPGGGVGGSAAYNRQQQQQQQQQGGAAAAGGGMNMVGGGIEYVSNQLKQSAHPVVAIFHVLFKACALALYVFGGWLVPKSKSSGADSGARFIGLTVVCILLLAADFWVVKNVTGRLLVGLRWWNRVNEDSTTWIFESAEDKVANAFDRSWFWTVLYATPCVWGALFLLGLLKLQLNWLLIVTMALALSVANVYGYYKCSTDQKAKFEQMVNRTAQQGAVTMMRSSVINMVTGRSSNNAGGGGGSSSNTFV